MKLSYANAIQAFKLSLTYFHLLVSMYLGFSKYAGSRQQRTKPLAARRRTDVWHDEPCEMATGRGADWKISTPEDDRKGKLRQSETGETCSDWKRSCYQNYRQNTTQSNKLTETIPRSESTHTNAQKWRCFNVSTSVLGSNHEDARSSEHREAVSSYPNR